MNTTPQPGTESDDRQLPALSEARIEQIEDRLFHDIAHDRDARRARRGRGWLIGSAAAAVVVIAAVIAPSVGTIVGGGSSGASTDHAAVAPASPLLDGSVTEGGAISGSSGSTSDSLVKLDANGAMAVDGSATRDIISTASATVIVGGDVSAAAMSIGDAAQARGGYVESMSVGSSGQVVPMAPTDGGIVTDTMPYPSAPDGAWITVRVPSDELSALVEQLSSVGEVTSSTINRQDVTEQTVDLRARVDAAQASVDRITALMSQAGSLADVIAAESALAERQATLESYQQQLKYYDEQVAFSTLSVTLTPPASAVEADPAGFADGLVAGWNGLVATLNGIVIALGFLIPWIVIVGVVVAVIWAIGRLIRRARRSRVQVPTNDAP